MSAVMTSLMLAVALLLAGPVGAETGAAPVWRAGFPMPSPSVSVDQTRGTILDALDAISKQAGWSLVVTDPETGEFRTLAIRITKRPATDALNLVLEAGALRATFADGVLKVRPDVPPRADRTVIGGGRAGGQSDANPAAPIVSSWASPCASEPTR